MDDKEKSGMAAAGCLIIIVFFACLPPLAICAVKYIVACWRLIGPLD